MFRTSVLVTCLMTCLVFPKSNAQVAVGVAYGMQIPGRQDLKFRYYENDQLIYNIRTTYVRTKSTAISNFFATYWKGKYGGRLDYYSWEHYSTAKTFLNNEIPPFFTVEQAREALLISPMVRFNYPFKNEDETGFKEEYSFIGIGLGEALTEVDQGKEEWRAAFQLFCGISIPVSKRLRLLLEAKLLLTRDADTLSNQDGWFVDTSGRWHPFRFGPHWDTKYHVLQIAMAWKL
ncbi:MAG: hypothetical protein KJO23_06855 [Bacteroidia bacterium]|nr:hypothetical protein [Bacteroidia bacterium]NNM22298.1 hypothetical protein [Flavobacteriaceae bacterium]